VDQPKNTSKDPLHVPNGPMTWSKIKTLNALVLKVSTKLELLSMCKRGPIQSYLGHEVRTAKETKESYYNLDTTWVALSE
jgi:hypothetical protein